MNLNGQAQNIDINPFIRPNVGRAKQLKLHVII